MSRHAPDLSGVHVPLPDPSSAQVTATSTNVVFGGMMGLAFLLTVLIVIWRFRSSAHPVATT